MKPEWMDSMRRGLARGPQTLSRLAEDGRAAGSLWTNDQFRLFFSACEGFTVGEEEDPTVGVAEAAPADSLADAIFEIVQAQGGRPVPLAKVMGLLSAAITTSVGQIRAVAASDRRLHVTGPVVRLREGV